jgi:hypothetical protein
MKRLSFTDWLAYGAIAIAAIILALDTGMTQAKEAGKLMPSFISSPVWGFAPLVLLMVGGAIFLAKQLGFVGAATKQSSFSPAEFNQTTTQVFHRTFSNQTVPLDHMEYVECKFENVTFTYEGHGVARMYECSFAPNTKISLKSGSIPISQAILIMNGIAKAMGGRMPDSFDVEHSK